MKEKKKCKQKKTCPSGCLSDLAGFYNFNQYRKVIEYCSCGGGAEGSVRRGQLWSPCLGWSQNCGQSSIAVDSAENGSCEWKCRGCGALLNHRDLFFAQQVIKFYVVKNTEIAMLSEWIVSEKLHTHTIMHMIFGAFAESVLSIFVTDIFVDGLWMWWPVEKLWWWNRKLSSVINSVHIIRDCCFF